MFRLKNEYSLINLARLQNLIDVGTLDISQPTTLKSLYDAGIENLQDGIKILASVNNFLKNRRSLSFRGKNFSRVKFTLKPLNSANKRSSELKS